MAQRLTGKEVSRKLAERIEETVRALAPQNIQPTLALVRVGDSPDDVAYENTALKRAMQLGFVARQFMFPESVSQPELEETIQTINADNSIHGCLMFRPLPSHLDEAALCDLLSPEKDIDGISEASLGALFVGKKLGYAPCTAAACMEVLDYYDIDVSGKHVAVVGRSLVVGKPVAMLLLERNATVTMCHSRTSDLPSVMRAADIVICATGRPKAYHAESFSPHQVVIDVGINFDEEGTLCGDVDFSSVEPVVAAITPVPGGVGGVTTTVLLAHVAHAAQKAFDRSKSALT